MSKIKTLIPDDFEFEGDNNMSGLAEEMAGLEDYRNSIEGQLAGFTDEQLQDEVWRRQSLPLTLALAEVREIADRMLAQFAEF